MTTVQTPNEEQEVHPLSNGSATPRVRKIREAPTPEFEPRTLADEFTSVQARVQTRLEDILAEAAVLRKLLGAMDVVDQSTAPRARGRAKRLPAIDAAPKVARKPKAKAAGRLARRSDEEIAGLVAKVVALVKAAPEGLRAEQIRGELGLQPKEMPRVLKAGLAAKALKCKGSKRATTYFAK